MANYKQNRGSHSPSLVAIHKVIAILEDAKKPLMLIEIRERTGESQLKPILSFLLRYGIINRSYLPFYSGISGKKNWRVRYAYQYSMNYGGIDKIRTRTNEQTN